MREIFYSIVYTNYNTTQDMINELQIAKGESKLNFHQNISNYYDEMNYRRQSVYVQSEKNPFSKNAESISKIYHEVIILMKF